MAVDVRIIRGFQRNEITEHIVYQRLAQRMEGENADILRRISENAMSKIITLPITGMTCASCVSG
ncbi:MAG: hypothetical protein DRN07_08510 [Thermoplasmata archaeon]|nr:MAG: hypothetical protein DRN07_08510 [Thermoplasmata archaeon]